MMDIECIFCQNVISSDQNEVHENNSTDATAQPFSEAAINIPVVNETPSSSSNASQVSFFQYRPFNSKILQVWFPILGLEYQGI